MDLLPSIRDGIAASSCKVVILDDDPTGTQTVRDLPVLTVWSEQALREELALDFPAFFILTNSRSMPQAVACDLAWKIGTHLRRASEAAGVRVLLISRSDSTLRGHFPAEVDAMAAAMGKENLPYLLLPFFLEGGRYTVGDVHYVREEDTLVPVAQTPFASDAAFGFKHSDLKDWVEEKTGGKIAGASVTTVTIDDIRRGGPDRVAEALAGVGSGQACIANAASYRDMEVIVAALLRVEKKGKEFLYRTAASFVRTRLGIGSGNGLLAGAALTSTNNNGGLFLIGSYVPKTGLQVKTLLEQTRIPALEVDVGLLLDPQRREEVIARIAERASATMGAGGDIAVFTSRKLVSGEDAEKSLEIGRTVSESLIAIVRAISVDPRYLVVKGGITSSDVATKGLGVRRAMVMGQALPGVPVWRLGPETRYPGMPYIIFPGNVGESDALARLQRNLRNGFSSGFSHQGER